MAGEIVKSCSTCAYNDRNNGGCRNPKGCLECLRDDEGKAYKLWQAHAVKIAPKKDSGAHASYYEVEIKHPKSEGAPYTAECQDIIDALGMDFNEGNAFKALWRRCAARNLGKVKAGNENPLYDAQKIAFYSTRILKKEEHK